MAVLLAAAERGATEAESARAAAAADRDAKVAACSEPVHGGDSIYGILHRECFSLFPDEMFADLFTDVGRRSVPPMIVAVVMVLQRIEGLSDREASDRFAFDARWKYAAGGLDFDYPGFAHTVLVDMRAWLARSGKPGRIFDAALEAARQAGLVSRRRVLDSTPLYDAVATMDTVTLVRSAVRGLLRAAAGCCGPLVRSWPRSCAGCCTVTMTTRRRASLPATTTTRRRVRSWWMRPGRRDHHRHRGHPGQYRDAEAAAGQPRHHPPQPADADPPVVHRVIQCPVTVTVTVTQRPATARPASSPARPHTEPHQPGRLNGKFGADLLLHLVPPGRRRGASPSLDVTLLAVGAHTALAGCLGRHDLEDLLVVPSDARDVWSAAGPLPVHPAMRPGGG